jgi:hypothetical protein
VRGDGEEKMLHIFLNNEAGVARQERVVQLHSSQRFIRNASSSSTWHVDLAAIYV